MVVVQIEDETYKQLLYNMLNGFAFHKIILDDKGKPIDYIFLDINPAFEKLTGLKKEKIIGKKVTDVIPGIEKDPADWIGKYGKVALTGKPIRFEQRAEALQKDYSVSAYSPMKGYFVTTFEDITCKKRNKEILLRQAEKFTQYVDLAGVILVALDKNGDIYFMNKYGCDALGYSRDELIGKNWFRFFIPKNQYSRVYSAFKKIISGNLKPVEFYENPISTKSGKERQIFWHNALIRNRDGEIVGTLSSGQDITERKIAEKELEENISLIRNITENFQDAIFAKDKDRRYTFVNPAAEKMIGLPANKIIGKTPEQIFSKKDAELVRLVDDACFRKKIVKQTYKTTIGGRECYLNTSQSPVYSKKGKINGIIGIVCDVTQKIKSEEELKTSEMLLQETGRIGRIGGWEFDIVKNKLTWTDETYILHEMPVGTPLNVAKAINYYAPESRQAIIRVVNAAIKNAKPYKLELQLITAKGNRIWVYTEGHAEVQNGKTVKILGIFQDITERKRIEIELENHRHHLEELVTNRTMELTKQTKFLNSIVENIPNMIFVKDAKELRFEKFNKAGEMLLGIPRKAMIGKNDYDFFPKSQADFFTGKDREVLKSKKLFDIPEEPIDTKYGKRYLHTKKIPILDENGKPIFLLGISDDITKRKKMEEALHYESERYRSLFESSKDAIMTLEPPNWNFTSCNLATVHLFNAKSEKRFIACTPWEISPQYQPDGRLSKEKAREMIEIAMKKGSNFFEWTHKKLDGKLFPATVLLSRLVLQNGKPCLQATVRDISSEKEMKQKLADSEKFLEAIVSNIPDAVYVKDANTLQIRFMNTSALRLFGKKEKQVLGKTSEALYLPYLSDILTKKDLEAISKKEIIEIPELQIVTERKSITLKIKNIPVFDSNGSIQYLMVVAEDITKSKEIDQTKSKFISSVSHELRSPLTPIKSQTQRMLEHDIGKTERTMALEVILRNTVRLDRLIQDIIEVNRIQANRLDLVKKPTDLNEVINYVLSDLETILSHRKCKVHYVPEKLPKLNIDRDRVIEIFVNLIDNASKYGKGDVWIGVESTKDGVIVSVKDKGIGITKREIENIFTPFFRSNRSAVLQYEGTGLGLSIVKSIVELHGGKIWVTSKLNKGTTIFFLLPYR